MGKTGRLRGSGAHLSLFPTGGSVRKYSELNSRKQWLKEPPGTLLNLLKNADLSLAFQTYTIYRPGSLCLHLREPLDVLQVVYSVCVVTRPLTHVSTAQQGRVFMLCRHRQTPTENFSHLQTVKLFSLNGTSPFSLLRNPAVTSHHCILRWS